MARIILLSGKKGTGKNTVADMITSMSPDKAVELISFADPIKRMAMDCFGLTHKQCYGESGERETSTNIPWAEINMEFANIYDGNWKRNMTAREVLQTVGTDVLRTFWPNIWANAAKVAATRSKANIVIFTDARFQNEIDMFKGIADIVRIRRNTGLKDNHSSEIDLDKHDKSLDSYNLIEDRLYGGKTEPFDFVIDNNGSMHSLAHSVEHLIIEMDLRHGQ